MYAVTHENESDGNMMEKLEILINLNLASCSLKMNEYELAKHQCDLVMKLDSFNIKTQFRRAQALVNMGLKEEDR